MAKIKLALLAGGVSGERDVSLNTGKMIYEALNKEKYEITKYDPKTDLRLFCIDVMDGEVDIVFPALHGPFGEDGKLQGMLDCFRVPYVFSGCLASALAMNKHKTKLIADDVGIPVAKDLMVRKNQALNYDDLIEEFSLPIVIKPVELGSSVGMAIAKTKEELQKGIEDAFEHGDQVMIEQYIKGRELTVTIMGEENIKPLPVIEIIPKVSDWFDYKAKYEPGASEEVCPAKIPVETKKVIQEFAVRIFKAIGCKDLARADFIWNEDKNKIYFLEINTIPGMTATSLAPQAAKVAGMEFGDFLDELIGYNIKKS